MARTPALEPVPPSWLERLRRCRRGAVSVMFAAGAIPMIGLVGLAVDFGIWNETNSQLAVAANVAALTAVRIAANAEVATDPNWQTEGVAAGDQWFASEVGINSQIGAQGVKLVGDGNFGAKVSVTQQGTAFTATVQYGGTVPSVFGFAMFGYKSYPISGQAAAVITTAPYLNVVMMLDDSSSMQIGATDQDIETMQTITPCNPVPSMPANTPSPGAAYGSPNVNGLSGQNYSPTFQTTGYNGDIPPPYVYAPAGVTPSTFVQNVDNTSCAPYGVVKSGNVTTTPYPGAPCAFACHFASGQAGTTNDYYGLARSTNGQSNQVTLRFDLVKQATKSVVKSMQTYNISQLNNLQVGIYSFEDSTTRAYPDPACGSGPTCEAGNDWSTALTDVGGPASTPNGPDTGIQPAYTPINPCCIGDTNFDQDMTQLQGMLTPSGDGTTPQTPRKVLFLVTDGMCDGTCVQGNPNRNYVPMNPADCATFKNPPYNYTVYVVYTPYYPLMNQFYIQNLAKYAEPLSGSPLYNAMQACASTPQDFISATNGTQLTQALQTFLKQALNSPARFTQ